MFIISASLEYKNSEDYENAKRQIAEIAGWTIGGVKNGQIADYVYVDDCSNRLIIEYGTYCKIGWLFDSEICSREGWVPLQRGSKGYAVCACTDCNKVVVIVNGEIKEELPLDDFYDRTLQPPQDDETDEFAVWLEFALERRIQDLREKHYPLLPKKAVIDAD